MLISVKWADVQLRETWNEPNGGFWRPRTNVEDYIPLAQAVGEAIRLADPQASYIGPAFAGVGWRGSRVPIPFDAAFPWVTPLTAYSRSRRRGLKASPLEQRKLLRMR